MRAVFFAGFAAALAGCGACEPSSSSGAASSASASAAPAPSAAPRTSASTPAAPAPKPPRAACRNVGVEGDVRVEGEGDAGTPLLLQGLAPQQGWIDLAPGAKLVTKDPRTTRETTFRGPGRVRACVDLVEESWVAGGTFQSNVGAGEGPGAEEWLATPLGVLRYTAAKLEVTVTPAAVNATLSAGAAFAWVADDAAARGADGGREDGWIRLDPGLLSLRPPSPQPPPLDAARGAAARCLTLGKASGDLAAAILAGSADAGTIVAQVATRREARAACAVASVRAALLPPSEAATAVTRTVQDGLGAIHASPP